MKISVKICGLSTLEGINTCVECGAQYLGFVFFPKSPRNVTIAQAAELVRIVPKNTKVVALVVNATDTFLDDIVATVKPDILQLHGSETVERVMEIKQRYKLPVMKAIGVSDAQDLLTIDRYSDVCDQILVDTKPQIDATLPGGNGVSFDWNIVSGYKWRTPWMLAGGLNASNIQEAISTSNAVQVDLSSAVESAPGVKDCAKIREFFAAVHLK